MIYNVFSGVQQSDSVTYIYNIVYIIYYISLCIYTHIHTYRDVGLIPGLGRSPGGGNGRLLTYYFLLKDNCFENFAVFCQTSTWISHRYTYIPSLLNLPPHPTPLGWYRTPVWVSWAVQQIPIGYFTYGAPVFLPENFMNQGAWGATVHGVEKSWTWLSN